MTVCVAAICEDESTKWIVGASDRMITAGNVEFEPDQPKAVRITDSIGILLADDMEIQAEIIGALHKEVQFRTQSNPGYQWSVAGVANLYSEQYSEVRRRRAENAIMKSLGLTCDTFLKRQREFSDKFSEIVIARMCDFPYLDVEAIIAGTDKDGAHISVVSGHDHHCIPRWRDTIGFACIGAGASHADSQMMNGRHTPTKKVIDTTYLVFAAKKRAEVAPGVGKGTDLFGIADREMPFTFIAKKATQMLDKTWDGVSAAQEAAFAQGRLQYLQYLFSAATAEKENQPAPKDAPSQDAH